MDCVDECFYCCNEKQKVQVSDTIGDTMKYKSRNHKKIKTKE